MASQDNNIFGSGYAFHAWSPARFPKPQPRAARFTCLPSDQPPGHNSSPVPFYQAFC